VVSQILRDVAYNADIGATRLFKKLAGLPDAADRTLAADILLSRENPRLVSSDPEQTPSKEAEELIHKVEDFLSLSEVQSPEELRFLMEKLDTAIAIDNNPEAKQLREELIKKFGNDALK